MNRLLSVLSLSVLSLLTLAGCSGEKKQTRPIDAEREPVTMNASPNQRSDDSASKPALKSSVPARAGQWVYAENVDQKAGTTAYKASIVATNLLQFAFPYTGGSTATLTIRHRESDPQVYIEVSKGQFNRSFQGGRARIRFDGKPAVTYSLSAAANGRANIVFFDSPAKLISQLKTARNTFIQVEFEGQPVRPISFRTAGLQWDH